ncbi:MAG: metallophosphoesterase [Pirellulales bacterium]
MQQNIRRATWLTDIHLNFLWDQDRGAFDPEYHEFVQSVRQSEPDALLVGGDIAEAPDLIQYLGQLEQDLHGCPLYFVLGNHDCYRSSIRATRQRATEFCSGRSALHYLSVDDRPVALTQSVALVGHDGWADGRFGELEWSQAKISDYTYIDELREAGEDGRRRLLSALGDEAAEHLRKMLSQAVEDFPQVILLTHVPPWLQVALHRGKVCDLEYAPHFASRAVGEAILDVMAQAPQCQLTVLCGHTHSPAEYHPLPNVAAFAGVAEYGQPRVQRVIELAD